MKDLKRAPVAVALPHHAELQWSHVGSQILLGNRAVVPVRTTAHPEPVVQTMGEDVEVNDVPLVPQLVEVLSEVLLGGEIDNIRFLLGRLGQLKRAEVGLMA
jgi:hypothetical protein